MTAESIAAVLDCSGCQQ